MYSPCKDFQKRGGREIFKGVGQEGASFRHREELAFVSASLFLSFVIARPLLLLSLRGLSFFCHCEVSQRPKQSRFGVPKDQRLPRRFAPRNDRWGTRTPRNDRWGTRTPRNDRWGTRTPRNDEVEEGRPLGTVIARATQVAQSNLSFGVPRYRGLF